MTMHHTRRTLVACLAIAAPALAQDFYFTAESPITELNTSADERSPTTMHGELLMVFASNRPGGSGGFDLWQSVRTAVTQPWSTPTPLGGVNTPADELDPHLSCDGLILHFASSRPGSLGVVDLYVATRPSTAASFGLPVNLGPTINGPGIRNTSPCLTTTSLALFFASDRSGNLDIWRATRPTPVTPFGAPSPFAPANSAFDDHSVYIEGLGEVVWFVSNRPGGAGGLDLWLTCGNPTTGVYGAPQPITELNTSNNEADGSRGTTTGTMFYGVQVGDWDLYGTCSRMRLITAEAVCIEERASCVQVSAAPPRYQVGRTYTATVTTIPLFAPWQQFRWNQGLHPTASVLFGSLQPLSAPLDIALLFPGSFGYLVLSSLQVMSLTFLPAGAPPGLDTFPFVIPGNPSLVGIDLHMQWALIDTVLATFDLSGPTTLELR